MEISIFTFLVMAFFWFVNMLTLFSIYSAVFTQNCLSFLLISTCSLVVFIN